MDCYGGIYYIANKMFGIKDNGHAIISIDSAVCLEKEYGSLQESDLTKQAAKELEEYFKGTRYMFSVPLSPQGSLFALEVYQALCQIPYGETRSYKQIACAIGRPKAARAVGLANHKNPILIMIPCHRVIGSNGKLVGYANGLDFKMELLKLESQANFKM